MGSQKLRPVKAKVTLTYECPLCQRKQTYNLIDVKNGSGFVCVCGATFLLEKLDVKLVSNEVNQPLINKAVKVLKSYISIEEAQERAKKAYLEHRPNSPQELVRLTLAGMKDE